MPRRARGRAAPGSMNSFESAYAQMLEAHKRAGVIRDYSFEPLKLRLAKATYYTPDFLVLDADGYVEFHEVKGFWREDARVKTKVAAETFPWARFVAVTMRKRPKREGGAFEVAKTEEFTP